MATVWLSYAWEDNKNRDVDFIAQELIDAGLTVKQDRFEIQAGHALWAQIEKFICNPSETDAWLLYMTQASLLSKPCQEEYSYALGRALDSRGEAFPVIGLSNGEADRTLIPAGIKNRLYVSLQDPDWKERIVASVEGRKTQVSRSALAPCHTQIHHQPGSDGFVLEVRPRAGVWPHAFAAIPIGEKDRCQPQQLVGPSGAVPTMSATSVINFVSEDGTLWVCSTQSPVTAVSSLFVIFQQTPSQVIFGTIGTEQQFTMKFSPLV